jgi:hypothetical protein
VQTTKLFTATVDFSKSVTEMISIGNYLHRIDFTDKVFSIMDEGIVEYEFKYIQPSTKVSSEAIFDIIKVENGENKDNPWEPARIEHLLTFGNKHPEEQRKHSIAALGREYILQSGSYFPVLHCQNTGHDIGLHWRSDEWDLEYVFLMVRKIK